MVPLQLSRRQTASSRHMSKLQGTSSDAPDLHAGSSNLSFSDARIAQLCAVRLGPILRIIQRHERARVLNPDALSPTVAEINVEQRVQAGFSRSKILARTLEPRHRRHRYDHLPARPVDPPWCRLLPALRPRLHTTWRERDRPQPASRVRDRARRPITSQGRKQPHRVTHYSPASLRSAAVVADSTQTLLCTYLSAVLLVGLLLNTTLGWSWADPIAGLVIAATAAREGVQAWRGEGCCAPDSHTIDAARAGEESRCGCAEGCADGCCTPSAEAEPLQISPRREQ